MGKAVDFFDSDTNMIPRYNNNIKRQNSKIHRHIATIYFTTAMEERLLARIDLFSVISFDVI